MNKRNVFVGVLVGLLLLFSGFIIALLSKETKLAYVNTGQIYEGFKLKKELEARLSQTSEARKNILDSLRLNIQMTIKKIKEDKSADKQDDRLEFIRQQYIQKKQQFDEDNEVLAKQYTSQVWEQLNQYVKDYGKQHGYKFIFGTNGEGSLMFAKETDDISKQLILYVNSRYEGKAE